MSNLPAAILIWLVEGYRAVKDTQEAILSVLKYR